jgi:hypothetical protein
MNKIDLKDVTFVIPVRIDCIERLENIFLIIDYLYSLFDTNIIVLESDKKNSNIIYRQFNNEVQLSTGDKIS